jgi:hypothetical protein
LRLAAGSLKALIAKKLNTNTTVSTEAKIKSPCSISVSLSILKLQISNQFVPLNYVLLLLVDLGIENFQLQFQI